VKRFRTVAKSFTVQFIKKDGISFEDILNDILQKEFKQYSASHMIGVDISHSSLDRRVLVPFTPIAFRSADKIMDIIERIQRSNNEFQFDSNMQVKFIIVEPL